MASEVMNSGVRDDLKKYNKYEEWIEHGSYFGIVRDPPDQNVAIYKNMHGEDVGVNEATTDPGKISGKITRCFPIFKFVRRGTLKNLPEELTVGMTMKYVVEQGKHLIMNKTEMLTTSGLATCVALAIRIGNKKVMSHVDATTNIHRIIRDIQQTMTDEKIDSSGIDRVRVWEGTMYGNWHAIKKVDQIIEGVGIDAKKIHRQSVCFMTSVSF